MSSYHDHMNIDERERVRAAEARRSDARAAWDDVLRAIGATTFAIEKLVRVEEHLERACKTRVQGIDENDPIVPKIDRCKVLAKTIAELALHLREDLLVIDLEARP